MRKLAAVSAPILPTKTDTRFSYDRRQRARRLMDTLTCLMVVRHQETPTEIYVSMDGNPLNAVWLKKTPVLINPKNRGRFLVVTLTRSLASQKHLYLGIVDRAKFLPEELADLEDAITAARRTRERMLCGGRQAPLHPNATA